MTHAPGWVFLFAGSLLLGGAAAAQDPDALRPLEWMSGCWMAESGGGWSQEIWTEPTRGLILGLSRSVSGRGGVAFEYMRIETVRGEVALNASPGGGSTTAFPAVEVSRERFRVERPDHDFPQAIEYRPIGADSMVAEVFGGVTDVRPAFTLPFARATCPGEEGPGGEG